MNESALETGPRAEFQERANCINCGAERLEEVSRGRYSESPLRDFIADDPWGESPLPFLRDAEWVLVRCAGCGQVFHRRILTPEWNERRFSRWMSSEAIKEFEDRLARSSPLASRKFKRGSEYVAHALRLERLTRAQREPGEPVRLLDFGCGWGDFLSVCSQFGFVSYGVDRSVPRMDKAVVKVFPSLADLDGLPPFHAITLFEVLEHLDEPAPMLRELVQRLKPGGVMILETPDCAGVSGIRTREEYRKIHPLEHINAFTRETLCGIGERAGLRLEKEGLAVVTADLPRVVKGVARHFLGRGSGTTRLYFRKD